MSVWRAILGLPVEQARPVAKRSYHAATVGRLFADFNSSSGSADAELRNNIAVMRNRARELARDDVYAKRYLELLETNVIGPSGMAFQVKARNTDGSLDAIGNNIIENAFATFAQVGNCTADGRMSWVDLQKYVIRTVARDGEAFVQVVRNRSFVHGLAFHPFEADMIDEDKNQKLSNGHEIRMGVEVDQYQRPVAFYVKEKHPGDYQFATMVKVDSRRVPAADIIHVYKQDRAGQTRGATWLAAALTQVKMLNAHREAELVASRMAASKMGFFTSESGEDAPADGYENGVPMIDAEPGTFHQLPAGVDFKPFDPSHPATAFAEFQKGILRGLASGLGVSYASLSNDLEGTSYSSIRQGALEERDAYKNVQNFVLEHFVLPAYATWLRHVMEFGYIPIPATRFDKFYNATIFRPRGWQWVDPQKEINAAVEAMHNGIMSMQDVSSQYGRDVEETFSQWQRDKETAEAFGLELAFFPFGGNAANKPRVEVQEPAPAASAAASQNDNNRAQIIVPPPDVTVNVTRDPAPVGRKARIIRDGDGNIVGMETVEE